MLSLGLRFHVISVKKRAVRAALIDNTSEGVVACTEHVLDGSASQARQARDARDWLRSALAAHLDVGSAVLFEADRGPRSSDTDAARQRLRIEGAVLTAALDHIPIVDVRNGKRIGDLVGGSKEAALVLGVATGAQTPYVEAAAAALCAIKLA